MAKEASRLWIKRLLPLYHGLIARFDPSADERFLDPSAYPWIAELERVAPAVAAELDGPLAERERLPAFHEVEPGQDDISSPQWKTLIFRVYGVDVPENLARCPETERALAGIPGLTTAMLSILGPGTHVPAHRGPFKGVLRCQLALRVPKGPGRCEIRVGDELRGWQEECCLVFDDTNEHEVWNETDEPRAILFLDFLRPLPAPLSALNRALMGLARFLPAVRHARRNAARLQAPAAPTRDGSGPG